MVTKGTILAIVAFTILPMFWVFDSWSTSSTSGGGLFSPGFLFSWSYYQTTDSNGDAIGGPSATAPGFAGFTGPI